MNVDTIAKEIQEIVNLLPFCTVYNTYTLFKNNLPGLKFPRKEADTTCVTTCLTAFDTGASILTPFAISAAGFGAAIVLTGSLVDVFGVRTTNKGYRVRHLYHCVSLYVQRKNKVFLINHTIVLITGCELNIITEEAYLQKDDIHI